MIDQELELNVSSDLCPESEPAAQRLWLHCLTSSIESRDPDYLLWFMTATRVDLIAAYPLGIHRAREPNFGVAEAYARWFNANVWVGK